MTMEIMVVENQTENKMKHEMESSVDYCDSFLEDVIINCYHSHFHCYLYYP